MHQPLAVAGILVDSKLASFSVRLGLRKQSCHGSYQEILQTISTRFATRRDGVQEQGQKLAAKPEIDLMAWESVFVDPTS